MTETDATKRPLKIPKNFLPYLDSHRLYKVFKDMVTSLVIELPKDHLKHMKVFVRQHLYSTTDPHHIIILVSPELQIETTKIVKEMLKLLGVIVITRQLILDRYEKHPDYEPGCISPELMSEVTKALTTKEPVPVTGWLMFDHPCTVREAKCLQEDGVLPNVTLALIPPPPNAPPTEDPLTPERTFFDQEFDGLCYTYNATLKHVYIEPEDTFEKIAKKCINGILATISGLQGVHQGFNVLGAPGVYRVLLLGPRGSGKCTQARRVAETFGLVYVNFNDLVAEAKAKNDEIAENLRRGVLNSQMKSQIVKRRLDMKDSLDHGWVLINYPNNGLDFENLDKIKCSPNRIIFLNADWATCRERLLSRGYDWCTGKEAPMGSGPRIKRLPANNEASINNDLEYFFSEAQAELRANAGLNAVTVDASEPIDQVQVRIEAAIMSAPRFDINFCPLLNDHVHGE